MIRPGNAAVSVVSIRAASSAWEAVPLPRQSRNSTGSATGDEQNGSRTTIAAITHVFPNVILFPPCADPSYAHRACATFLAPPLEERPVHRDRDRPAAGAQVLDDQAGHRHAQVIGVPRRVREEPARPPEPPGHPRRRGHRHHRAPAGQDHPARQRDEQRMGGPAPERRRQILQQGPPGRGHGEPRPQVTGIPGRPGARARGTAVLLRVIAVRAGRDAAQRGRLASQGSLTESDDLDSHVSYGASLLLSRRHAPGYQIVTSYHHPRSARHAKPDGGTCRISQPGTSSAWLAPLMLPAKRSNANRRQPGTTRRTKLGNTSWRGGAVQVSVGDDRSLVRALGA